MEIDTSNGPNAQTDSAFTDDFNIEQLMEQRSSERSRSRSKSGDRNSPSAGDRNSP